MAAAHDDPTRFLPLSPSVFHVVVSLADHDRHGYAIIKEVAGRTGGDQRLAAGTLYAILKRLLDDGLIAEVSSGPAHTDDQRRRYYRLTSLGRQVAKAEVDRLEQAVASARASRLFVRTRST